MKATALFHLRNVTLTLCSPISDLILTLRLQFKYKEVYEHMKANGYTLGPNDVPFVNVRRVNNVTSEVL